MAAVEKHDVFTVPLYSTPPISYSDSHPKNIASRREKLSEQTQGSL